VNAPIIPSMLGGMSKLPVRGASGTNVVRTGKVPSGMLGVTDDCAVVDDDDCEEVCGTMILLAVFAIA